MADRKALRHWLVLAVGAGSLFLMAAVLSDLAARHASGLETIWPGNALILGLLVIYARGWRGAAALVVGAALGGLLFHVARGDPPLLTIAYLLTNLIESLIGFALLRPVARRGRVFDRVSDVLAWIIACAVGMIGPALVGGGALVLLRHSSFPISVGQWYASGLLSQLVAAPAVVIVAQFIQSPRFRTLSRRDIVALILVLALVAVVTGMTFLWTNLPLLFLIMPVVLVATFRLRACGAVGAVAVVALVAGYATTRGLGPIVAALPSPAGQALLLQLFIGCCFLTALPVAAMLSERELRADEARESADRFKAVVETIGEVIFRVDREGQWVYLNPAWEKVSGYAIADCLGHGWLDFVDEIDRAALILSLDAVLRGDDKAAHRVVRFTTASSIRWMEIYFHGLPDKEGRIVAAAGTLRDIDDRKRSEDHVRSAKRRAEQRAREATLLASTDELTGIANRRAFMRQLEREIAGAAEFGWPLAVAIFDIDHFKKVNDLYGHSVGDKVLQRVAGRAAAAVRGGDLVGRLGGEEFGILMPGATADDAALVAERLRLAIETRATEDGPLPPVTVSIGIATREQQREAPLLLSAADAALYEAKGAGRNRVRVAA